MNVGIPCLEGTRNKYTVAMIISTYCFYKIKGLEIII